MTTSIMIHRCNSIRTTGVFYGNANAITMEIQTGGHGYSVTLFNLPAPIAERLDKALNGEHPAMSEEEIRADERRKIAEKLGL